MKRSTLASAFTVAGVLVAGLTATLVSSRVLEHADGRAVGTNRIELAAGAEAPMQSYRSLRPPALPPTWTAPPAAPPAAPRAPAGPPATRATSPARVSGTTPPATVATTTVPAVTGPPGPAAPPTPSTSASTVTIPPPRDERLGRDRGDGSSWLPSRWPSPAPTPPPAASTTVPLAPRAACDCRDHHGVDDVADGPAGRPVSR